MFGRVIDGMLTLRKIENVPTGANNRPKLVVKIVGSCLSYPCQLHAVDDDDVYRVRRDVMSMQKGRRQSGPRSCKKGMFNRCHSNIQSGCSQHPRFTTLEDGRYQVVLIECVYGQELIGR